MACDSIQDGVILDFLDTGVKIAPLEADIRTQRNKYAVGEFRLSKEAGEAVAEHVPDDHPCVVHLGGEPAFRLMKQSNAIEFQRTLRDKDVADLRLNGAGYIVDRGTASKNFTRESLRHVVRYIYNQIEDEYNVLNGWQIVPSDISDDELFTSAEFDVAEFAAEEATGQEAAEFTDIPVIGDIADRFTQTEEQSALSISLDNPSPAELLDEVSRQFEISWWVDTDGVLNVGHDTTYGSLLYVSGYTDSIVLNRYSITSTVNRTNGLRLESQYSSVLPQDHPQLGIHADKGIIIAEVRDPTLNGSMKSGNPSKDVSSPAELQALAEQALFETMVDQTSGSIEINGLASTQQSELANLSRGDIIYISDSVGVDCNKDVSSGTYFIQSIHHLLSGDRGWSVNIDLARVPDFNSLESKAVFYDPLEDKEYDTFEDYKNANS